MPSGKDFDVIVIGVGSVGQALVRQLRSAYSRVKFTRGIGLRVIGLADRSGLLYNAEGLPEERMDEALAAKVSGKPIKTVQSAVPPVSLSKLAKRDTLFVDATAAPKMAQDWCDVLNNGAGVVLANKLPLCEKWNRCSPLFNHPRVRYEATVGAGLPVISTQSSLQATGDCIDRMEGALSGTLGYLASNISEGVPFSKALAEAVELGYAEPDPSEDLSGRDVARKAVILSRSAGWPVELSNVRLDGLISEKQAADITDPAVALAVDASLKAQFEAADLSGETLRYMAQISPCGIRVGLAHVARGDAFTTLAGPENRVAFYTKRYARHPLGITGPGAGSAVTASGVLSYLISLAERAC